MRAAVPMTVTRVFHYAMYQPILDNRRVPLCGAVSYRALRHNLPKLDYGRAARPFFPAAQIGLSIEVVLLPSWHWPFSVCKFLAGSKAVISPSLRKSTGQMGNVVTTLTDRVLDNRIFSRAKENSPSLRCLGITSHEEIATGMKSTKRVEKLVSERWPKLKKRAQNENSLEKLIAILEEIDDLLFNLEKRVGAGAKDGNMLLSARADADFAKFLNVFKKSGANEGSRATRNVQQHQPNRE